MADKIRRHASAKVVACDAGGELGEDFPWDGAGFAGEFGDEEIFPEEDGFVAAFAVREVADVDNELIHGDAAEEGAGGVANEDVGVAFAEGARITVAVANAKNGGAGGFFQQSAPVGNAVAGGEGVGEGDARFERHDGTEFFLVFREWGEAVEEEAGAGEVGGFAAVTEEAGAVGEVNPRVFRCFQTGGGEDVAHEAVEKLKLRFGEGGIFVGYGKV